MRKNFMISILTLLLVLFMFSVSYAGQKKAPDRKSDYLEKKIMKALNSTGKKTYLVKGFDVHKINSVTGKNEYVDYEEIGEDSDEDHFIFYKIDIDGDGREEYFVSETNDEDYFDKGGNYDCILHIFRQENGQLKEIFLESFISHSLNKIFLADFMGDGRYDMVINEYCGGSAGETFDLYEFSKGKPSKVCELEGKDADFGSFHIHEVKYVPGSDGKKGAIEINLEGRKFRRSQGYYNGYTMIYKNGKFVEKIDNGVIVLRRASKSGHLETQ